MNLIKYCRTQLQQYYELKKNNLAQMVDFSEIDNQDIKELYLKEKLKNAILRKRLYNCKNDNNKLKKQYLDVIHFLTRDKNGEALDIKKVSDITYDLDAYLSVQMVSFLKNFKKLNIGIPNAIYMKYRLEDKDGIPTFDEEKASKEWNQKLDSMILAFELARDNFENFLTDEQQKQKKEGLQYFVDYFDALWR